jgi:hypothetical protein
VETFVTVAVLLALIALGAFVIHRLNVQHAERIAEYRYSRFFRGLRAKRAAPPAPMGDGTGPAADDPGTGGDRRGRRSRGGRVRSRRV